MTNHAQTLHKSDTIQAELLELEARHAAIKKADAIQDELLELEARHAAIKKEQLEIPQQLREAVEAVDMDAIRDLRQRSIDLDDEVFTVGVSIHEKRMAMYTAEDLELSKEQTELAEIVKALNVKIQELDQERAPHVSRGQQIHKTRNRLNERHRKEERELKALKDQKREKLQLEAANLLTPPMKAFNVVGDPLLKL